MIVSFADRGTEDLYHGRQTSRAARIPRDVARAALQKLDMLDWAEDLRDIASPPGNRLEALHGDFEGFRSVRVNIQWRIVFRWDGHDARDVRLIDYH